MKRRAWQSAVLMLMMAGAVACSTEGTGVGESRGGLPVTFTWKEQDAVHGQMTATLPNGEEYRGRMYQITSNTRPEEYDPLWAGWPNRGGDWGYWEPGPEFTTHYSGRVLANLVSPEGDHMRCDFSLVHPSRGMRDGGVGRCQLSDGRVVDATFPAA
jgi:hypothetical protein